ncbi:protein lethal(2)essential for life [Metopolophium dirhodum]|uniref:protein lethal(2)essential for life n=1 Tax=Metopolophium dirhodum TaxID=44670 RepID=UPI0029903B56|nr:protein lethal(2)essential for life [Metopolophium dirhodum]XP_060876257.1 protein lethal(2)essential for life [Metopolophium dirhodum]XP_060876258.1 protein lethal(2)essential for life [Metopolophium dirhodum]
MSLVPLFFRDWWEDFERERLPRRLLDQHFGLGLHRDDLSNLTSALSSPSLRSATYYRPWQGVLNRQNSGTSNLKFDEKQVQVILDVQQFGPGEITVKTSEGAIIVEGKHEEKQDEHGFISRQFKRRYLLPKDVDIEQIVSSLSSDGILTVSVPKKETQVTGERSVPIIQTGIPAVKAAEAVKNDETPIVTEIKVEHQ